jgi:hypothetical protein
MYDLTTAVKKLLALDTLNEDRKIILITYKKCSFSMVDKPLILKDEVKKNKNNGTTILIPTRVWG